MLKQLITFVALLAHGLALPAQEARVTEKTATPPACKRLGPASDAAIVHLQVGIKQKENAISQLELRLFEGKLSYKHDRV